MNWAGRRVSVGEFAGALEKVLRGFAATAQQAAPPDSPAARAGVRFAPAGPESGQGRELFFFPRLRDELQRHLQQAPRVLRFRGLRGCVKQLTGARRWSLRCRDAGGRDRGLPAPVPERRIRARRSSALLVE